MSSVIQFLASVGSKPLTAAEYGATVALLDVEDSQRQALFGRDHGALADLLGGRSKMYCMVVAPNEEDEPEQAPDDEPEEKQPEE